MGATSVTGVGNGAAWGNKGPHNGRDQFVPLVGSRIIRSGTATLASASPSVKTVGFPPLDGEDTDYVVMAVPVGATAAIAAGGVAVSAFDASAGTFVLTGPNSVTTTINWMIIKI